MPMDYDTAEGPARVTGAESNLANFGERLNMINGQLGDAVTAFKRVADNIFGPENEKVETAADRAVLSESTLSQTVTRIERQLRELNRQANRF